MATLVKRQDNRYLGDSFLTILVKFFGHFAFYTPLFWHFLEKNMCLTAKIKNTTLVALESAESLYQVRTFREAHKILKKSSSWFGRLLSKCTKHEEDCANFSALLRKSEFNLI